MKLLAHVTAVVLTMACAVGAEVTTGKAVAPSYGHAEELVSQPSTTEKANTDTADSEPSKDAALASKVMKEHLSRDDSWPRSKGAPPGSFPGGSTDAANLGRSVSNAVKDVLKPIQDELNHSGLMDTVRTFESDMGIPRKRESTDMPPLGYSFGRSGVNSNEGWVAGSNGASGSLGAVKSSEQVKREKLAASILLDELINDITPWGYGFLGLLALGYVGKLWLNYRRRKAARPGKRRRSARRRRHHRES